MYRRYIKRILDLIVAAVMIFVMILPLLLVAVIIKLSSKGPVLFRQERFGKNSKPFTMYKFRSMAETAPIKAHSEFSDIRNYVTPFGMLIRKTSIDELPQLINILKGEMSFIGPRPLAQTDIDVLKMRRSNGGDHVLPGISGLAQVNGRNDITDDDKAMYDAEYAKTISLKLDICICVKTIVSVIKADHVFKER